MRRTIAVALLALAAACSESGSSGGAPPERRDHPLAQDGSAARAITSQPDQARVRVDLAAVRGALQTWKAEHNAWPGSISELGLTALNYPDDLTYDASTGTVTSQTYPAF
jgi:hypothetical protein